MKPCTKCGAVKPPGDFYATGRGSLMSACKRCHADSVRARRRLSDVARDYDRQRGNRQSTANIRDYRTKHPDAYRAHNAVSNAIRDGKLTREPCLFCGEVRVHGHHRDYSRPLDVVWLCAKCHHRLHAYFPETAAHEPKRQEAA